MLAGPARVRTQSAINNLTIKFGELYFPAFAAAADFQCVLNAPNFISGTDHILNRYIERRPRRTIQVDKTRLCVAITIAEHRPIYVLLDHRYRPTGI